MFRWWTGLLWPNVDLSLLVFDGLVYCDQMSICPYSSLMDWSIETVAVSLCSVDGLVYWDPACLLMPDLGLHCYVPFDWSTGWGIPRMWLWIFQWSMHFQEINPFHALLQGDHSLPDISSGLDLLRLSYLLRRFVLSSLRVVYVPILWFPFNPCLLSGLLFEEGVREQVSSLLWYLYFFIWLMLMMSDVHWSL